MNSEEFRKIGYQLIDWIADYHENLESKPISSGINIYL